MGRDASKAAGNVWYEARISASKYDEKLRSREGAAERLGMSTSAVSDAELGVTKFMPADKAMVMAQCYNAPHLLNFYCLNECPIGNNRPLSDKDLDIDRVTVRLLKSFRTIQQEDIIDQLLDIAEDGVVSEDEMPKLQEIMEHLDELAKVLSEIQTISRRVLKGR